MRRFSMAVVAAFVLVPIAAFTAGCGGGGEKIAPTENPAAEKVLLPEIAGTNLEKSRAIAARVTTQSDGLVFVEGLGPQPFTDQDGNDVIGIQYNAFLVKPSALITDADTKKAAQLLAEIFQLTAKHILADDAQVAYISVRTFEPNSIGGNGVGAISVARENALATNAATDAGAWFQKAQAKYMPETIVPSVVLSNLMRFYEEALKGGGNAEDDAAEEGARK